LDLLKQELKVIGESMMNRLILIFIVAYLPLILMSSEDESDGKQFLYSVRMHRGSGTWADLTGEVVHQRRGGSLKKSDIHFAIRFTATQVFAKLLVGKHEGYTIGLFTSPDAERKVSVIPFSSAKDKEQSILKYYGIRPEDLTMSFLYWDFVKELPSERISMQACRVFCLRSPEKQEEVTVFISEKYLFPLKVEWRRMDSKESYRDLSVASFKKVNGLWLTDAIVLSGPGWRTKINFDSCEAGTAKEGIPQGLFSFGNDK